MTDRPPDPEDDTPATTHDRPLVADGAYGTLLAPHVATREPVDLLNTRDPRRVIDAHAAYLDAGATRIQTNTFLCFTLLARAREDTYRAGIECARESGATFVAATIGPIGREAKLFWRDIETILDHGGATHVLCETVTDRGTALAFSEAWRDVAQGVDTEAILTVSVDPVATRTTTSGVDQRTWEWVRALPDIGEVTLGLNCCTGPVPELREVIARLADRERPPLVQPSAGLPDGSRGGYPHADPMRWAEATLELLDGLRVGVVGGCCGTTPAHVEALSQLLAG